LISIIRFNVSCRLLLVAPLIHSGQFDELCRVQMSVRSKWIHPYN
jgi:hypothetical protein